ncbi:unnamed protein product [Linum trigynum]|uniref:Aminotransferase-like plant mobile domain-containing protein n=1 Tax=Linum trigynum TaxID=586398 RepID=A0AAV2FVX4_9ROSI
MEIPRSLFTGIIRFSNIVEGYDHARCLCQFGYRKIIPRAMMVPHDQYRMASGSSYTVLWDPFVNQLWDNVAAHRLDLNFASKPYEHPSEIVDEYVDWYLTRSHPRITHPSSDGVPQQRPLLVH